MTLFAHITRPANDLARCGATIPKQAQAALDLAAQVDASLTTTATADLAEGIASGTVTAKNITAKVKETAVDLIAAERAHVAAQATIEPITRLFYDAIRANADTIVDQLRDEFDTAAATVQEAGRHFGPETSPKEILHAGIEATAAWQNLTAAIDQLNRVRTARGHLAEIEGTAHTIPFWALYVGGIYDGTGLDAAESAATRAGQMFHNLAHSGLELRLNTSTEAAQQIEQANEATEQQAARNRQARIDAHKANSRDAHDLALYEAQKATR